MNLIVTSARHLEPDARGEIVSLLKGFGDEGCSAAITRVSGVLTASTSLDPVEAVRMARAKLLDEPWSMRYCLRIIPVQEIAEAEVGSIVEAAGRLAGNLKEGETYRISIKNRDGAVPRDGLITSIAATFKNEVSLEYPDKVILVEVLGTKAGVSIIRPDDILSAQRARRDASE